MTQCIFCGFEISQSTKEWNYHKNYYNVKLFECPACLLTFREYHHNGKFSHTIPKYAGPTKIVLEFLKTHEVVSVEEVAKILKLKAKVVLSVLSKLEKEGLVENVSNE